MMAPLRLLTKIPRKALVNGEGLSYFVMLKNPEVQQEPEWVSIDGLAPVAPLLRKIDGAVDFSFIRPHPVQISQQQQLEQNHRLQRRTAAVDSRSGGNVVYRWFLGVKLRDKVPDASTLRQTGGIVLPRARSAKRSSMGSRSW